jgi:mRNA-degrading endonuclease RelE of RelBE toxin-antitoxin system
LAFLIEYSPDAEDHLRALTARQRAIVLDTVDEQLLHEPDIETGNRKPMRPNPVAPWELRIGNLRIYYDIMRDPDTVLVRAIGIKIRNTVSIGKEVIEL